MTRVLLSFTHDGSVGDLQAFLDAVKTSSMLNSHDNEEGSMIHIENFQYRTEQA